MLTSLVQAQGFDLATATKWTSELLVDFCDVANFSLGFVPDAALLIPPEQNVYVDHHELIDAPKSNADVLGDADSAEVTAALLRRRRALRVGPLPVFDPRHVSRDRRRRGAAVALTAPSCAPTSSGCSTSRMGTGSRSNKGGVTGLPQACHPSCSDAWTR